MCLYSLDVHVSEPHACAKRNLNRYLYEEYGELKCCEAYMMKRVNKLGAGYLYDETCELNCCGVLV